MYGNTKLSKCLGYNPLGNDSRINSVYGLDSIRCHLGGVASQKEQKNDQKCEYLDALVSQVKCGSCDRYEVTLKPNDKVEFLLAFVKRQL